MSDVLDQLKKASPGLAAEILIRAQIEQTRTFARKLWELDELLDEMREVIKKMKVLGWEIAIRGELERRKGKQKCLDTLGKKRYQKPS